MLRFWSVPEHLGRQVMERTQMINGTTYSCDECGQIFESAGERNAHGRSDHPKYRKSRELTDEEAAAIRERLPVEPPWPTGAEYEVIASEFNINWMTVKNIAMGTSYRRVKACPLGILYVWN